MMRGGDVTAFGYRTFSASGEGHLMVRPTVGLLRTEDHLVPILDALRVVLRSPTETASRVVLRVEATAVITLDLYRIDRFVAVARLTRGSIEAVLVAIADMCGDPSAFEELQRVLVDAAADAEWDGVGGLAPGAPRSGERCVLLQSPTAASCAGQVAHFISWSRHHLIVGTNSCSLDTCSGCTSDHLAAKEHLAAWVERHDRHGVALAQCCSQLQVCHDLDQSVSISRWAYTQTAKSNGLVWVRADELRHLAPEWERLLAVA